MDMGAVERDLARYEAEQDEQDRHARAVEERAEEIAAEIVAGCYSADAEMREAHSAEYQLGWDGVTETAVIVALVNSGPDAARKVLLDAALDIARPIAEAEIAAGPQFDEPDAGALFGWAA